MTQLTLAVLLAAAQTVLTLTSWTGASYATATSVAVKYRLHVAGRPSSSLVLRAGGLAKGWLAAFCTPKVCSPMQAGITLPASGEAAYQFELIREDTDGPAHSGARITSSDGAAVTLP